MSFSQGHAFVVGVGADLPNTVEDAKGFAAILWDEERCAYPREQVILLTGQEADPDGIRRGLDRLSQAADKESTVVVYFSGHGYRVTSAKGTDYFLMPYGYELDRLGETAVSGREFATALKKIPAQKLLVLLDCCHAAGVDQTKSPGLTLGKAPIPPEAEQLLAQGQGRVAIASSKADEVSFAGKPYSAFTLALIEGLTGTGVNNQDGYVRVADLAMYTGWRVPARTRDRQHPVLRFEKADNFVVAYYAGGEAKPKAPPFAIPTEIEPEPGEWSRPPGPKRQFRMRQRSPGPTFHNENMRVGGSVVQAGRDATGGDVSYSTGAPKARSPRRRKQPP